MTNEENKISDKSESVPAKKEQVKSKAEKKVPAAPVAKTKKMKTFLKF